MAFVKLSELAAALNLSPRHVNRLVAEGMPRAERGTYDLEKCLRWYVFHLQECVKRRDPLNGRTSAEEIRKQRARLLQAQAQEAEIGLAAKRGALVPVTTLGQYMGKMITTARQLLLNVPGRVAPALEGEQDRTVIKSTLQTAIHDAMNTLTLPEAYLAPGACSTCGQQVPAIGK